MLLKQVHVQYFLYASNQQCFLNLVGVRLARDAKVIAAYLPSYAVI